MTADEITEIFAREVEKANSCNSDTDCVVFSADCPLDCWYYINKDKQIELRAIHDELIDRYEAGATSCSYGCVDPMLPVCLNLKCIGRK